MFSAGQGRKLLGVWGFRGVKKITHQVEEVQEVPKRKVTLLSNEKEGKNWPTP